MFTSGSFPPPKFPRLSYHLFLEDGPRANFRSGLCVVFGYELYPQEMPDAAIFFWELVRLKHAIAWTLAAFSRPRRESRSALNGVLKIKVLALVVRETSISVQLRAYPYDPHVTPLPPLFPLAVTRRGSGSLLFL